MTSGARTIAGTTGDDQHHARDAHDRGPEAAAAERQHADRGEQPSARAGEARVQRDGRDPEARGGEESVGGDPRAEVEGAVHAEGEDRRHAAEPDADAPGLTPPRPVALPAPDGTATAAEQMRPDQIGGDPPRGEQAERRPHQPQLHGELQQVIVREREVHLAGRQLGRLVPEIDVPIGAEPDAEHRKGPEHAEARAELQEPAHVEIAPEAIEQRLEADPGAIARGERQEQAHEHEARPHATREALQRQERAQRHGDADDAPAAQREDEGERHDGDRDHGQGAADQLLARPPRRPGRARVLGRARPGEHVADSEADQHLEPRGEMIRIDEGARQPGPRRGLAPSEEPGPAGEVVEEREKRHHPAEEQQHPQQAVEPEARPHEIDDEDVHRGVGEEEAEGARGLRR